jgi:hypothetical protein
MFRVTRGGSVSERLTAGEAVSKARSLRRAGHNDVEIFRSDGSRISLYALDQIIRSGTDDTLSA